MWLIFVDKLLKISTSVSILLQLTSKFFSFVFVVFAIEEGNSVADKAVTVALNYIKKTSKLGLSVDLRRVVGNKTDSQNVLDSCK